MRSSGILGSVPLLATIAQARAQDVADVLLDQNYAPTSTEDTILFLKKLAKVYVHRL
jgi:hypothetical protein